MSSAGKEKEICCEQRQSNAKRRKELQVALGAPRPGWSILWAAHVQPTFLSLLIGKGFVQGRNWYYFHVPLECENTSGFTSLERKKDFSIWWVVPSALGVGRWCHPPLVTSPVSSLLSKELGISGKGHLCVFLSPFPPKTPGTGTGHRFREEKLLQLAMVHCELSTDLPFPYTLKHPCEVTKFTSWWHCFPGQKRSVFWPWLH